MRSKRMGKATVAGSIIVTGSLALETVPPDSGNINTGSQDSGTSDDVATCSDSNYWVIQEGGGGIEVEFTFSVGGGKGKKVKLNGKAEVKQNYTVQAYNGSSWVDIDTVEIDIVDGTYTIVIGPDYTVAGEVKIRIYRATGVNVKLSIECVYILATPDPSPVVPGDLFFISGNNFTWIDGNNAIPVSQTGGALDLADLTNNEAPSIADAIVGVDDVAGTPEDVLIPFASFLGMVVPEPGGRLTGVSGDPAYYEEQSAITTLYYTPYRHNSIPLYDTVESAWQMYLFSEISIAVPATTDTNYDVFAYLNSGVVTLELLAWTNDSTRATSLSVLNGRYVKSTDNSRLHLGVMRTGGTSGQTEDTVRARFIANTYNQIVKSLYVQYGTGHSYTTSSWRPFNNDTTNTIVEYVVPHGANISLAFGARHYPTSSNPNLYISGSLDSTTSSLFNLKNTFVNASNMTFLRQEEPVAAGYHYSHIMEYGGATGYFLTGRLSVHIRM